MRRYILSLPADLALVDEAGNSLLPGTVVCPMPGTVAVDGRILADVEAETIDLPEGVTVLACQADSGDFVTPLDADEFVRYLAPVITYDEAGEVIDTQPAELHQPHQMGGWPDITLPAPVPATPVPEAVSMRQARLALLGAGLLDTVEAAIAAMPGIPGQAARIEWEYAHEIRRDSPLVAGLTAALGLTDAALDGLFLAADGL